MCSTVGSVSTSIFKNRSMIDNDPSAEDGNRILECSRNYLQNDGQIDANYEWRVHNSSIHSPNQMHCAKKSLQLGIYAKKTWVCRIIITREKNLDTSLECDHNFILKLFIETFTAM